MGKKVKKKKKVKKRSDASSENVVKKEDYETLRKRYLRLKKEHEALEKAFNRISVLEEDIRKVHAKIDSIDANSEAVEKELKAVKSRVTNMQTNVKKIAYVATKVSKKYGVTPRPAKPQTPQGPARPGIRRRPLTKAAKALSYSRKGPETQRPPETPSKKKPTGQRPRPRSDEISVEPSGDGKAIVKDHKEASERMDAHDITTDLDDETMDYLVKENGKTQPLSKRSVDKAIKEKRDEEDR
jgi:hypothetical protein